MPIVEKNAAVPAAPESCASASPGRVRKPGTAMICVQTVLQEQPSSDLLIRQQHRIALGSTIRELLQRAGTWQAIDRIASGALGLSCHGKRAWLDDVLCDGARVEMLQPIRADAKAARAQRVAEERTRRKARSGVAAPARQKGRFG